MEEVHVEKKISASLDKVYSLIINFEKWLRFNPSWFDLKVLNENPEVKKDKRIDIKISFEDDEKKTSRLTFKIEEASKNKIHYILSDGKEIELIIEKSGNGTLISHRETLLKNENYEEKEKEINQWLDAIKHYSELNNTFTARLSKLFIDKVFMRMNPMQRRITLIIILLQAAMLITTMIALLVIYVNSRFNP